MAGVENRNASSTRGNLVVAGACVAVFSSMVGMAYASVPLYRMFCQITGYGGTTQRVEQYSDKVLDREITVRFDANVAGGLPWDFKPSQREIRMRIGETVQANFEARNFFSASSTGQATFNVSPHMAGAYFNKVECFCFTETELKPGGKLDMPVVFYVDPAIVDVAELKNIHTITLSYTFFPLPDAAPVAGAALTGDNAKSDSAIGG